MIPTTLDECFPALDALLGGTWVEVHLKQSQDIHDAAISLHHSLGTYLRNEWGLWRGSDLAKHLTAAHGIQHPDDMSHFILTQYCRAHCPTLWQRLDASH